MSCNPAIGGIAKGHLVREVDALGGIMGEVTDAVGIQFRLLNTSRGPAVWSPRAQCDKTQYRVKMREVLEWQPNLEIKQAEVAELVVEKRQQSALSIQTSMTSRRKTTVSAGTAVLGCAVRGISLRDGRRVRAQATDRHHRDIPQRPDPLRRRTVSRRDAAASRASVLLGESLKALGLRGMRLKTGTPPRLDGRTIDWSKFEVQPGDADPTPFSFRTKNDHAAAGAVLHRVHHAGDAPHHPRERASLARCTAGRSQHRPALLPVDRRQDRQIPRQAARTSSSSSPRA